MKNFRVDIMFKTCSGCKHMVKTFKMDFDCNGECLKWTLEDSVDYNIKNIYLSCCDEYEERSK